MHPSGYLAVAAIAVLVAIMIASMLQAIAVTLANMGV